MSWILGGLYCGVLWLVFAKLKLLRLSLPLAVLFAAVGPALLFALLFCAQYYHPFTSRAQVYHQIVPIAAQLTRPGRVSRVVVEPNKQVAEGDLLFQVDPIPYQNTVDRLTAMLQQAEQGEKVAESTVRLSQAALERASANLDLAKADKDRALAIQKENANAISQAQIDVASNKLAAAKAEMQQAEVTLTQSQLAVETARVAIDEAQATLASAAYDLEQTNVVAPGDGYVTNLQLEPGMLVGGAGGSSVMSFVLNRDEASQGVVVAAFPQKNYLLIKEGNYAEVAFNAYPGQIFTGHVLNTIDASGTGQLTASGILPSEIIAGKPTWYAVRIRLDEGKGLRLPGGSQAQAAVYTENVQIAGVPIMFLIRAKSWMHYLL